MPLAQLQFQHSYRTGRGDLVREFFVPCLEQSVLYRRAAGYFSSHGLGVGAGKKSLEDVTARGGWPQGGAALIRPPGAWEEKAKPQSRRSRHFFVVSFHYSCSRPPRRGCPTSPHFLVQHPLAEVEDALLRDRLNALAWFAAAGFLQIRLALRVDADGHVCRGIFHEKTGIFTDPSGDHVAFTVLGKTLTALVLASRVAAKNTPIVLIVTCPFINLCKQWLREMAAFGLPE